MFEWSVLDNNWQILSNTQQLDHVRPWYWENRWNVIRFYVILMGVGVIFCYFLATEKEAG